MFECNICLDTASDPVVTMCGHFYCWPCIAMWLERSDQCPVCKSVISKEKIIPVYARGAERKDPREKDIPHRPAGHREEPSPQSRRQRRSPWNFESSFNFGLFPGFSFVSNFFLSLFVHCCFSFTLMFIIILGLFLFYYSIFGFIGFL